MSRACLRKFSVSLIVALTLAVALVNPVLAFGSLSGQDVVIPKGEVINDDLYVSAANFTLEGTINGDLFVVAQAITINGVVDGGLFAAGQTIVINGIVKGSTRIAGAALYAGGSSELGKDLLAAGASLETRNGGQIGRDLAFVGGQARLGGDVSRNAFISTNGLEILGRVGGNVTASVGSPGQNNSSTGMTYFSNSGIPVPPVPPGLTIDPTARISGNLYYTSMAALPIPGGVVAGQVFHTMPSQAGTGTIAVQHPSIGKNALNWFVRFLRNLAVLILLGLLVAWLFPKWLKNAAGELQTRPWWGLLWGAVSFPVLMVVVVTILFLVILLSVVFSLLTLWSLSGLVVAFGLLGLFVLVFGFILAAAYFVKIVVGDLLGKLILNAFHPDLGKHKIWRLLLGLFVVAFIVGLPFIGWLFAMAMSLFGLGALWMASYRRMVKTS
jgi:hypothetical protein